MNKILIIDDEAHCRNVLRSFVPQMIEAECEIYEADSVQSGLSVIADESPDIVFLDVQMSDGTGFDILDKCIPVKFQVIFTTAYDQYALKAFNYAALHYLLKPISKDELKSALDRCELKELFVSEKQVAATKAISLTYEGVKHKILINQICYVNAEGSYCTVHLKCGSKTMVSKNIGEFEKELSGNFFRSHKSYLVNIGCVGSFDSRNNIIITSSGSKIPVSRRNKSAFIHFWEKWLTKEHNSKPPDNQKTTTVNQ